MSKPAKIRLFVSKDLGKGQVISLDQAQSHYLLSVMRRQEGDVLRVFNGRDGEWLAEISRAHRKETILRCRDQLRAQMAAPDIWLLFAPIKRTRMEYLLEKATEIGVSRFVPVCSEFTDTPRLRKDRLEAIIREAVEQSEGLSVPQLDDVKELMKELTAWPNGRRLYFADEAGGQLPAAAFGGAASGKAAILIGPEGGFSHSERKHVTQLEDSVPLSLGPRILRAETTATAALALWHSYCGWGRA